MPPKRTAVITGLGIVSPIGIGVEEFWSSACAGRSGISHPTLFDASKLPRECQIVGEVKNFDPRQWMPATAARMAGRFSQFAVAAAQMAREQSGLTSRVSAESEMLHVAFGTSLNGQIDIAESNFQAFLKGERIEPWGCVEYPAHAATSHVAIDAQARGHGATFASACAAGLDAVAWAASEVEQRPTSIVIAGATDTPLSPFILKVFHAVGVLSRWDGPPEEASRPFDKLRSGLVLAEGAAATVVEEETHARRRGAPILARILGCSAATEGTHLRKVDDSGDVITWVINQALRVAGVHPHEVDAICAHGNSMQDYDAAETVGIKHSLGSHAWNIPVFSIKGMTGQALAASSAMQVVTAALALQAQQIPPTINYRVPDPVCDLDYVPNQARIARIRTVLIHGHSLGGTHAVMILAKPD
jgi:3-oxoacyl-[acyl-carrier-protein] synthase II